MCLCHTTVFAHVRVPADDLVATHDSLRITGCLRYCFPVPIQIGESAQYASVSEAVRIGSVDPFMATIAKFQHHRAARETLLQTGRVELYHDHARDRLLEYVRALFLLGHYSDVDQFPRIRFVSLFALVSVRHRIESVMVRYPVVCEWICTHVSLLSREDLDNINRLPTVYLFIVAKRLRNSGADVQVDRALGLRMCGMSIQAQRQFLRDL